MNKIPKLFSFTAFVSIFSTFAIAEPDPNFHIYLMVGQSNMEGAATVEAQDRETNARVMVLQDEACTGLGAYGQWRVASPPLVRCSGRLGPGDTFGKIMANNSDSNVTIGLVGAAHGGQKIEYFLKNCGDYNACQPSFGTTPNNFYGGYQWLIDLARKAQERGVIKGIIFHQGESNTGDPAWPGRVNQLVTDIRQDLGVGDIPFIAGELPYPACCSSHNSLIAQLPSVISNAHVVSAAGLNIYDQYHFDSAGVREMGQRYANKMLQLVDTGSDNSGDTGANTITVRLSGVVGDEAVNLQVGGNTIKEWTATTYMSDYTIKTDATGEIRVGFSNDNGTRDVQVDYIVVNGVVRQAEDQDDNTGVWANDACGGGALSEWLNCNGSIGFGGIDGSRSLTVELETLATQNLFGPFTVHSDSSASNGQYIEWTNNGSHQILSTPSDSASGQVAIRFTLTHTTNVEFEIKTSMANGYDDSFYYQLDSGDWVTQNNQATNGWGTLSLDPFVNLNAGNHVLKILRREDGAKLDNITLSAVVGNIALADNDDGGNGGNDGGNGDYEVPEDNFAENGGAEGSLQNWSSNAGNISLSNAQSHSGSSSVLITGRTSGWHGITFNAGSLINGNEYDVAVWVRLTDGSPDTPITLTAKRQDDNDSSTYNEFEQVATATASANRWTLLQGFYTQSGTPFEHFIIESENDTVSFYADDFSIGGETSDNGNGNGSGNNKYVGNITTRGAVRSDFIQYWDQITPENEGKWGSVERQRDVYNWSGVDAVYNYAKQNNIPFKQHTFVWGSQYPTWIDNLSPSEQAAEIEEWIRDFCTRYPDVDQIDVVNEATPGHAPAGYAQRAFGNDWVIRSFQLARQYCPNAELILNDYNVLSWNTDEFIAMARPAVNAGVVDAIGLQAHGLADRPFSDVSNKLDRIAALGLPIYISEYDIEKTNDQEQLNVMKSQFPLFYNHPSVKGITLWGYVVGTTWRDGTGLIHSNGNPRPAMTWLMNYLEEQRGGNNGGGGGNGGGNQVCDLKTNYNWTSTGPLISPHSTNWASIKDPTVVKYDNKYHVFATVFDKSRDTWGGVYLNFNDFNQAGSAAQVDMSTTRAGNTVAPEVFYFEPHKKWYMIYQWGAKYSTNTDISNPAGWTTPQPLLSGGPSNGIDYWVICDDNNCHLFFSGDDGNLYRSKVSIGNFPNFSGYEIVMSDEVGKLFEASNVYKVEGTNKYLLLVEAYGPRYFRSWTSTSLDGPWTPLADTQSNPFAGAANVSFPGGKWTDDISHGEMIRSGYDQTLTINACNMQYLYQGVDPNSGVSNYNHLPYKIGLISAQ